jgi:hypothetical protein
MLTLHRLLRTDEVRRARKEEPMKEKGVGERKQTPSRLDQKTPNPIESFRILKISMMIPTHWLPWTAGC